MTDPHSHTTRLEAALAGRYTIERKLGEGGMATVFLAEDVKHGRKVAIKILRPELAAVIGAERFLAEIKTTANLQHPHILPLFDSGEADSFLYYVMPYVAGETLRERIEREQQLGVDEAVRIARGVAEALDYAHRNHVIHRDIKPANILLHDGNPVVADFGIALAVSAAGGGRMTETGLSLGTPHYMSPEQASAERDLSARSDIYSLGCVLYEMLAGQPPHTGPNAQSILVRILTEDPRPVSDVRRSVPPHVAATVMKSIEKLPADRFDSARQFIDALADETFSYSAVPRTTTTSAPQPLSSTTRWVADTRSRVAVALVAVFAAIAGWSLLDSGSSGGGAAPAAFRFQLTDSSDLFATAVSPDGTVALFVGGSLSVRRPGSTEVVPVPNTAGARFAAFSPDGEWLAYTTALEGADAGSLFKQPVRGGDPIRVSALPGIDFFYLAEWAADGRLYGMAGSEGDSLAVLVRVSNAGGALDTLRIPIRPGRVPMFPTLLPGGEAVLFSEMGISDHLGEGRLMAFRLETGDTIEVSAQGAGARWLPTGHLLYSRRGGFLEAVPFDPDRLRVLGPAVPVVSGVATAGDLSFFSVNSSGTLVYPAGEATDLGSDARRGIVAEWIDLDGSAQTLSMRPTDEDEGSVSPDGRSIAYIRGGRVWIYDVIRGNDRPLRDDELGSDEHNPIWSPDGTELVFSSIREGSQRQDLYRQVVAGEEAAVRVGGTEMGDDPLQWLRDGTVVLQATPIDLANVDLYSVPADGSSDPLPLLFAPYREDFAQVSPDGRWFAYRSDETGTDQVYVRRWPELDRPVQVSELESEIEAARPVQGATWSADSRTLYYLEFGALMAADLDTTDGVRVGSRRRVLTERSFKVVDVHPDGRFLRFRPEGADPAGSEPPRLMLVTNWFTELRERLGEGN